MEARKIRHVVAAVSVALLRHPIDFLTYLGRQAAAYDRHRVVRRGEIGRLLDAEIEDKLRFFMDSPPDTLLPQRGLDEIFGAAPELDLMSFEAPDESELPERERRAVARIVSALKPATVFEIGTYRGRTTRLLAACSPAATVHTLDLPPEKMLEGGCFTKSDPSLIGARFAESSDLRARIVQHFGDSRQFEFAPFYGQMDLVFVDASHSYEAVLHDSRAAFRMVREGGVVLWDDYHPIHGPGVMTALAELGGEKPIIWINGTRLALHWMNGPPANVDMKESS
jgi:predicted O-methyltransferase YrrM